jgi:hypothetical protein
MGASSFEAGEKLSSLSLQAKAERLMDLPHDGSESRELDMSPIFELLVMKLKVEEGHRFTNGHVESREEEMCLVDENWFVGSDKS